MTGPTKSSSAREIHNRIHDAWKSEEREEFLRWTYEGLTSLEATNAKFLFGKKANQRFLEKDPMAATFWQSNLPIGEEKYLWEVYNTIREIESSFRTLKTDLDLRPIYHKNDDATMAHLHLGVLAYWIVNTIRYQLKGQNIKDSWTEILRKAHTQKVITTSGTNIADKVISIRRCSEPNQALKELYQTLGYKDRPFTKRKSVVHKPKSQKKNTIENQTFTPP